MTRRDGTETKPALYLAGGSWLDGDLRAGAPRAAHQAQEVSRRLAAAVQAAGSISEVARRAGVARSTIYDVVSGETWPDFVTISKLEEALAQDLFP